MVLLEGKQLKEKGAVGICVGILSPVDEHILLHSVGRVSQRLTGHHLVLVVLIPQHKRQTGEQLLIMHPGRRATLLPYSQRPRGSFENLLWLL